VRKPAEFGNDDAPDTMASGPGHAGGRGLIAAANAFAVVFQHHIGTRMILPAAGSSIADAA